MRFDRNGLNRGKDYLGYWWLAGGSRYHMGIPNVKLGKFKVAITGLLMTLGRGKRKGIMWTREEPR